MAVAVRSGPAAGAGARDRGRVFREVDDPDHVFVLLEFESLDEANESRRRLLESGVLERFEDKHGPNVLEEAAPG